MGSYGLLWPFMGSYGLSWALRFEVSVGLSWALMASYGQVLFEFLMGSYGPYWPGFFGPLIGFVSQFSLGLFWALIGPHGLWPLMGSYGPRASN